MQEAFHPPCSKHMLCCSCLGRQGGTYLGGGYLPQVGVPTTGAGGVPTLGGGYLPQAGGYLPQVGVPTIGGGYLPQVGRYLPQVGGCTYLSGGYLPRQVPPAWEGRQPPHLGRQVSLRPDLGRQVPPPPLSRPGKVGTPPSTPGKVGTLPSRPGKVGTTPPPRPSRSRLTHKLKLLPSLILRILAVKIYLQYGHLCTLLCKTNLSETKSDSERISVRSLWQGCQ